MTDSAKAPHDRKMPLGGLCVFLAAVVPHLWTLGLEFAMDDYTVLPAAPYVIFLRPDPPRPDFERTEDSSGLAAPAKVSMNSVFAAESYLCRPTTSAWWTGLTAVGEGRIRRDVFRLGALLLHGATAWLLYRLLRRWAPPSAACLAASWFGFAPTAHQAFSWTAAHGDMLSLTLTLSGLLLWIRASEANGASAWLREIAGAVCFGAAFGAKESALAVFPAAGLIYLLSSRPEGRRVYRCSAAAAVAVGAMFVWRYHFLGYWLPRYPGDKPFGVDAFVALPALFGQMGFPWNRSPFAAEFAPLLVRGVVAGGVAAGDATTAAVRLTTAALFAPAALGLLFVGRRGVAKAALAILVSIGAVLPASWRVFVDDGSFTLSRNVYHGAAAMAALLAVALSGWVRIRPRAAWLVAIPLGLLALDATTHVAKTELRAARDIRRRLDDVHAAADAEPAGTRLVVVDPDDAVPEAGIGLVSIGYSWAFSALFNDRPIPVERWSRLSAARLLDLATDEPRRTRVVEDRSGRLVSVGPALAGFDEAMPSFHEDPARPGRFVPERPIAARAVAALELSGAFDGASPKVVWRTVAAGPETVAKDYDRGVFRSSADGRLLTSAPEEPEFRTDRLLVAVDVEGLKPVGPPRIVRRLPRIEILASDRTVEVGAAPRIEFRVPFETESFRIEFQFLIADWGPSMVYRIPYERAKSTPEGALAWRAASSDSADSAADFGQFGKFDLLPPLWEATVRGRTTRMIVRFRIEGSGPEGVMSRSPWGAFSLVEKQASTR